MMLKNAGMTLLMSVLAFLQLMVFAVATAIYVPILVVVGIINILYKMLTGSSFENIGLLTEPITWAHHQTLVLVGQSDEFWTVPYFGRSM